MTQNDPDSTPQMQAEDFTGFCMAIGYITQNWAMLEQNFDMCIAMIYHDLGGRTHVDKRLPFSFKNKVKFLRKAFTHLEQLRPFSKEAIPILDKALAISSKRNDLIHGALTSLSPIDGKWPMTIFDLDSPEGQAHWHLARNFTFSPEDFQALESKLVPLAIDATKFALRLRASIFERR